MPLRFHRTYIVIKHGTRLVCLAGITANPDGAWMAQAARNFLMNLGQHAASVKFLIGDRAGQFIGSTPCSRRKASGFSPALRRRPAHAALVSEADLTADDAMAHDRGTVQLTGPAQTADLIDQL